MWTLENWPRYDRSNLRYPSDVIEEELALIGPLISPANWGGNPPTLDFSRSGQRGAVHPEHGLSVGGFPEGPATAQHGQ